MSESNQEKEAGDAGEFKVLFGRIYDKIRKFADDLNKQAKHGVLSYYSNWRYYKDIIKPKQMMGTQLSRQESIQMKNFMADSLCFIPLFVYLSIPFSTFGLPLYIRYLSAILPSTFSTREMIIDRYAKNMERRTIAANNLYQRVKEREIRSQQKISLSDLDRGDIVLLYKCLGFKFTMLPTARLVDAIQVWEKEMIHDNKLILREGIQNLSIEDLQDIAYARGIHFKDKSYDQLLQQLSMSLILSSAPPSHSSYALAVMNSLLTSVHYRQPPHPVNKPAQP
eukprot:gene6805-7910_t